MNRTQQEIPSMHTSTAILTIGMPMMGGMMLTP